MGRKNRDRTTSKMAVSTSRPVWIWALWGVGWAWGFFVLWKFYQKEPFDLLRIIDMLLPQEFPFPKPALLLDYAIGSGLAFMVFCSALFLGRAVFSRFPDSNPSALEFLALSAGLGYGLLGFLSLAAALLGWVARPLYLGAVLVLFACSIAWFLRSSERALLSRARGELRTLFKESWAGIYLGLLLGVIFLTDIVMAFVPELFYDALVYHLGVPNFYLLERGWAPIDNVHAKFPFMMQMVYLIGLALKDETVTHLIHFSMMGLVALGFLGLSVRMKRPTAGLLAAILFCSIPVVQLNVWTSGVDAGVALFSFLAFLCFLYAFQDAFSTRWFMWSAVFSGIAMGSKYTAIYVPAVIGISSLILFVKRRHNLKTVLGSLSLFGLVAAAVVSPWLIKNWIEVGNPFFPFLTDKLGSVQIEPWRYEIFRGHNYGFTPQSFGDFFRMFWVLSIVDRSTLSFLGPLLLACVPLAIFGFSKWDDPWVKRIVLLAVVFLPIGLAMTRLTRYLIPGFTIVALAIALGIGAALEDRSWIRRWGALFIVSLGFFYQMVWVFLILHNAWRPLDVLLGKTSRDQYVSVYHSGMNPNPSVSMFRYMEKHFSKGDKVLLVGEEKIYPLGVRHVASGVFDKGPLVRLAEQSETAPQMADRLKDLGVTHLMVNLYESRRLADYGIFNFSPRAFGVFCAFWDNFLELQHVEHVPLEQGYTNPILLLKIRLEPRDRNDQPVENMLIPIYEKSEFPRMGIKSADEKIEFYQSLSSTFPNVRQLRERLGVLQGRPSEVEGDRR